MLCSTALENSHSGAYTVILTDLTDWSIHVWERFTYKLIFICQRHHPHLNCQPHQSGFSDMLADTSNCAVEVST